MTAQLDLDWTADDDRAEAGITAPWKLFIGGAGASIGVDHFGASADYRKLYEEFGITAERVTAAARNSLARVRA